MLDSGLILSEIASTVLNWLIGWLIGWLIDWLVGCADDGAFLSKYFSHSVMETSTSANEIEKRVAVADVQLFVILLATIHLIDSNRASEVLT